MKTPVIDYDSLACVGAAEGLLGGSVYLARVVAVETYGDLSKTVFSEVVFENCRFSDAEFIDCSFRDVRFAGCDLSNARFTGSAFSRVHFDGCKCLGADFSRCKIRSLQLEGSLLKYANFTQSTADGFSVASSDAREVFLSDVSLKNASFTDTDFTSADFSNTMLKKLDLRGCTLDGILVSESHAELRGAIVTAAQAIELSRFLGVIIK